MKFVLKALGFVFFAPAIVYAGLFIIIAILFISHAKNIDNVIKNSTIINHCFTNYKGDIYYYVQSDTYPALSKLGAFAEEFQALETKECIGKDSQHVFIESTIIEGADPKTFQLITQENYHIYSKDYSSVYYDTHKIEKADPLTFALIPPDYVYSKDENRVFYIDKIISDMKPEGMSRIYDKNSVLSSDYARDYSQRVIYYRDIKMPAYEPAFRLIDAYAYISTDNTHVFYKDQIVSNLNPSSLEDVYEYKIIKDNKNVVFLSDEIKSLQTVDASKFKFYSREAIGLKSGRLTDICGDGTYYYSCNTGSSIDSNQLTIGK